MQLPIIFLDVDGVLNNQIMYKGIGEVIQVGCDQLDRRCVDMMNNLVACTGAKIVLSSVWRKFDSVEDLLYNAGLRVDIIGKTPSLGKGTVRGNEIQEWIKDNKDIVGAEYWNFFNYVILDDDSDMLLCQQENFFLVDEYCGLTPNLVYRLKSFFTQKKQLTR